MDEVKRALSDLESAIQSLIDVPHAVFTEDEELIVAEFIAQAEGEIIPILGRRQ